MSATEVDPHGKQEWVIHYQWPTNVTIREGNPFQDLELDHEPSLNQSEQEFHQSCSFSRDLNWNSRHNCLMIHVHLHNLSLVSCHTRAQQNSTLWLLC